MTDERNKLISLRLRGLLPGLLFKTCLRITHVGASKPNLRIPWNNPMFSWPTLDLSGGQISVGNLSLWPAGCSCNQLSWFFFSPRPGNVCSSQAFDLLVKSFTPCMEITITWVKVDCLGCYIKATEGCWFVWSSWTKPEQNKLEIKVELFSKSASDLIHPERERDNNWVS